GRNRGRARAGSTTPTLSPPPPLLLPPLPSVGAPAALASTVPSPTPVAPPNNGILGITESPVAGLSIGSYGEVKFGLQQNPDAWGRWQNGFDLHRIVLLPTYAITPNIIFNAEIEFEHGGVAFDAHHKRHGNPEIQQPRGPF